MIAGRPHRDTGRKPVIIERPGGQPITDDGGSEFNTPAGSGRVIQRPAAPAPKPGVELIPELPPMTVIRRPRF